MRLKNIRLAGFKSFVDPTNIPFPGDMTAVVGPNGCGKSNVIDAVRWVLGESSAKNLRGDSMTDVIFNGSSARKPVSQCSVELIFDNTSGRIQGEFAAFNEISVKRIVTKDAISSYWLNNTKCRRRDVTDLFLGTGLGPRSYAIIEQGMISKLIESKPQDLRVFIEEAAGVSKYKERRKETQTRISHTKENLERLEDVRQELGDQIAKLKRQAVAAENYKQLKQQERQLKAELATIRWLAQSTIMQQVQTQISDKQSALDELLRNQLGDESGLQALKNEQSVFKQSIDDVQQQIFTVSTEITKLEQSQLFAKKRLIQIQSEVLNLKQSETVLAQALDTIRGELSEAQERRLAGEPQKEILEEQVFEIENSKYEIDDKLQTFLRKVKVDDDAYHNKKQILQQKHSQIQQSMSLQQRLSSRITELQEELAVLNSQGLDDLINNNDTSLEQSQERTVSLQRDVALVGASSLKAQQKANSVKNSLDHEKDILLRAQARLSALEEMQQQQIDVSGFLAKVKNTTTYAVWQYFKVQEGYEQALHSVLKELSEGYVLDARVDVSVAQYCGESTPSLLFTGGFTTAKVDNTLASILLNERVPSFTNSILLANTLHEALVMVDTLKEHQQVVCKDGTVVSNCSVLAPSGSENKLLRHAQINQLQNDITQLQPQLNELDQAHKACLNELEQLEQQRKAYDADLREAQLQEQQYAMKKQNLQFQKEQFIQSNEKLVQSIENQQTELAQEEMSLELLNEQVEDFSIEVAELEEIRNNAMQESEMLQQQQQNVQVQFNQLQSKLHDHAMGQQQLQNSITILQEQLRSKEQQFRDNIEKLGLLQEEAEDLLMPEHQQQEKLQSLLQEQESLSKKQQGQREALSTIELNIADIEKGKHGLVSKMDAIKAQIASLRIQSESANVRAQSHIEQLAELSQGVKDIIETLDEDADEKVWQQKLDKVIGSLSRLGAVNLAAVEEYEQQFERKQHLDAQNEDLSQALDTLENAMRKIDKETRSRFKMTFDKVNDDLKSLFPQVFGGGSAYLALTSQDLLETGVTIMARPPGKKNSTIHLLSGGEKALTALSLVFAIFRLNPAPFCLLDEVDAPLDDANVGRFCRLVSGMSKTVQFIYITHNKVAMEMATHLTGVTMAEPGVSRMVAVDMEEALAIAE